MGLKREIVLVAGIWIVFAGIGCETGRSRPAPTAPPQDQQAQQTAQTPAAAAPALPVAPAVSPDEKATLRCRYQPGSAETVRYSNEHLYKSWVEMPGQPAGQVSQRVTRINLVLRREIESVTPDGTAIMKVTFQNVDVNRVVDTSRQKKQDYYRSSAEKTESTWPGQPTLAGVSYRIKIEADTTVAEILDLEKVRQDLKLTDSASNLIGVLFNDDRIRKVHQRDFVAAAPASTIQQGQKYDKLFPLPDTMIKAQAIKKIFEFKNVESAGPVRVALIDISGEAAPTAPEGFAQPDKQLEMPAAMIKNSSDMQEFSVTGQGRFDMDAGRVLSENNNTACMLALFEENIMPRKDDKKAEKNEYGVMFTKISVDQHFEVEP